MSLTHRFIFTGRCTYVQCVNNVRVHRHLCTTSGDDGGDVKKPRPPTGKPVMKRMPKIGVDGSLTGGVTSKKSPSIKQSKVDALKEPRESDIKLSPQMSVALDKVAANTRTATAESKTQIRSALLSRLMDIDIQSQDMADAALQTSDEMMRLGDVADLLSKMKFAKLSDSTGATSTASDVDLKKSIREQAAALRRPLGVRLFERTSITAEQRLNIFDDIATFSHIAADTGLEVWNELDQLHKNQLSNARGPNNGWEEMAEWTRQGKLWTYPIDNENGQVLKGECDVSFVEHVFLSREIDAMGFAKTGPVREFMELVANGLSKNPYMSISTKRGHLQWFNNYFDEAKMIEIEQMSLLAAQASAELEADIEIAKKSQ